MCSQQLNFLDPLGAFSTVHKVVVLHGDPEAAQYGGVGVVQVAHTLSNHLFAFEGNLKHSMYSK
jgi:hypothetical protein